jgi:alpha-methylacyl-CoA racemase
MASTSRSVLLNRIFFGELCKRIGVSENLRHAQYDRRQWPIIRDEFARIFSTRTRDEWTALLEGSDASI